MRKVTRAVESKSFVFSSLLEEGMALAKAVDAGFKAEPPIAVFIGRRNFPHALFTLHIPHYKTEPIFGIRASWHPAEEVLSYIKKKRGRLPPFVHDFVVTFRGTPVFVDAEFGRRRSLLRQFFERRQQPEKYAVVKEAKELTRRVKKL